MAITSTTRRRVLLVRSRTQDTRLQALRGAVQSLRHFAEIEAEPAGQAALRKAARALEEVHGLPRSE